MITCWTALQDWFTLVSNNYKYSNYFEFWEMHFDGYPLVTYFNWFPENSISDYVNSKDIELYNQFKRQ